MKTIFTLLTALFITGYTYAQDFSKYENNQEVSNFIINKSMFKLMSKLDLDSDNKEVQEYIQLINNLEGIKIFSTSNKNMRDKFDKDAQLYIQNQNLEELMRVNDQGNKVGFFFKPDKTEDKILQLFIHVNGLGEENNETTIMIIDGLIDLKQISKLANDLDIPGSKSL